MRCAWLLTICCALACSLGCGSKTPGQDQKGPVKVVVSIYPLADIARQIGGEAVAVECLVPPGASPHSFSLTAEARRHLAEAEILILAGPTDSWYRPGLQHPRAWVTNLAELVGEGAAPDHDHDDHDGHDHADRDHPADAHYWLDPANGAILAEDFGRALANARPGRAVEFMQRGQDYAEQCRALAAEMEQAGAALEHKRFLVEHPAFGALAARMGLEQVGAIRPVVGVSAGPGRLRELAEQAKRLGAPVIFTEPQLRGAGREAELLVEIARQIDWPLRVGELDPLGGPNSPGRESYLGMLRWNMTNLVEGLGGSAHAGGD